MAVAVKTSPGARSGGMPGSAALISLVGVVYLLACLAIVFKLLPSLWWPAWDGIGLAEYRVRGGVGLMLVGLAAGVGLLYVGGKLLGPNPPPGVRSGTFVGFTGLLVVLGLTRWAGSYFEYYAFEKNLLTPFWGAILTGIIGGLLLAGWLRLFTLPWMQRWLVKFEEGGWFSATAYKSNQGRVIRRGTIIGILLLAGTGIWSLMSGGNLRRGAADWVLNIPFTGSVAVDSLADAREFVAELPAASKPSVQIKWKGGATYQPETILSVKDYQQSVKSVLDDPNLEIPAKVREEVEKASDKDTVEYLLTVNKVIHDEVERILAGKTFHADIVRRLREVDKQTTEVPRRRTDGDRQTRSQGNQNNPTWPKTDITKLLAAVKKEAETAKKTSELGWVLKVPTAVPVVDRSALQQANDKTRKEANVRVGVSRNKEFAYKEGEIVATGEFNSEGVRIYSEVAKRHLRGADSKDALAKLAGTDSTESFLTTLDDEIDAAAVPLVKTQLQNLRTEIKSADEVKAGEIPLLVPRKENLTSATGTPQFASITLLPAVQFTLPLLLVAASLWLAWRAVNLPAFADFLIATEAEMNKVSWTTQKRLFQDTIVVLVTVLLMAVFLFGMDYFWKTVLSWPPIGVLHIPEDSKGERQKLEEKKW